MFLTKIEVGHIDAACNGLKGYGWHIGLWKAFSADMRLRPFLYRVDLSRQGHRVLMLSTVAPNPLPWGVWNTKPIPETFLNRRRYYFQLRTNPVRRHEREARPVLDPAEIESWIAERLGKSGMDLLAADVSPPRAQRFKRQNGRSTEMIFNMVEATGVVEIADRELFISQWPRGIGRGRAFGFGLMLLKPLSN